MTLLIEIVQIADMRKRNWNISKRMVYDPQTLANFLDSIRVAFLKLHEAVAKHNARFRTLFPHSDPIYKRVEDSFFGAFDDMPRQVHAFADVVWEFASSSGVRHLASWEQDVQCILHDALTWAGRPVRTKKGRIQWKKMISFVEKGLVEDIQRLAQLFFEKVYALPVEQQLGSLQKQEREFWERYGRLVRAQQQARVDAEPIYSMLLLLQCKMPAPLCTNVARFVV